ncbi:MAG: Undecaprenyl-diphosphatase [Candidatus Peregrinibacteria bacterium GW2011_GWA2_47_7]|nr:MAG: Undecaprenyl-diphosphatase [Candidatus Peregrinibacteria bacterium GW2011_GWA2_47_7]
MNILHALILGIVEGVSEFLPISSTGHLILTGELLEIPSTEFLKSFEIIIQLGAILAVVVLYWRKFFTSIEAFKRIIVGFIPTAIIGLALYKVVKTYLLGNDTIVVWSLFIGGVVILLFELFHKEGTHAVAEVEKIPYKTVALIGVCQAVAIVPGVSRSAATIIGGLALGVKRTTITEFSFLLAVPLICGGASFCKSTHRIHQEPQLHGVWLVSYSRGGGISLHPLIVLALRKAPEF